MQLLSLWHRNECGKLSSARRHMLISSICVLFLIRIVGRGRGATFTDHRDWVSQSRQLAPRRRFRLQVLGANLKGGEAEFRAEQRSLCNPLSSFWFIIWSLSPSGRLCRSWMTRDSGDKTRYLPGTRSGLRQAHLWAHRSLCAHLPAPRTVPWLAGLSLSVC